MDDIKAKFSLGFNTLELDNLFEYLTMVMSERGESYEEIPDNETV